jgi:hypothetical protein
MSVTNGVPNVYVSRSGGNQRCPLYPHSEGVKFGSNKVKLVVSVSHIRIYSKKMNSYDMNLFTSLPHYRHIGATVKSDFGDTVTLSFRAVLVPTVSPI